MTKKDLGLFLKKLLGFDGLDKTDIIIILIGAVIADILFLLLIKWVCIFGLFLIFWPTKEIPLSFWIDGWNECHMWRQMFLGY